MRRDWVVSYGALLLLILGGAAVDASHLPDLMSSEAWTYALRSLLIAAWLHVGYIAGASSRMIRGSMFGLGGVYVAIGTLALFDSTIWGLNQQPLVGLALWLHIIYGLAALAVASRPRRMSGQRVDAPLTAPGVLGVEDRPAKG